MYIAPGRDRQPIGDKNLWHQKSLFSLPICCKFQNDLRNLILYTFLMILYMYIAPRQRQKTPWGHTFDVSRKRLPLRPFVASFKQNLFEFWFFYPFFLMFFHMYIAPEQGQTTLCGQKSNVNRKALSLYPFVASLKNIFWSLILYIFLPVFIHVYSPGAGADNPMGSEFLF